MFFSDPILFAYDLKHCKLAGTKSKFKLPLTKLMNGLIRTHASGDLQMSDTEN